MTKISNIIIINGDRRVYRVIKFSNIVEGEDYYA
jgi:hypothetical protein